jgi:hypothetical protein
MSCRVFAKAQIERERRSWNFLLIFLWSALWGFVAAVPTGLLLLCTGCIIYYLISGSFVDAAMLATDLWQHLSSSVLPPEVAGCVLVLLTISASLGYLLLLFYFLWTCGAIKSSRLALSAWRVSGIFNAGLLALLVLRFFVNSVSFFDRWLRNDLEVGLDHFTSTKFLWAAAFYLVYCFILLAISKYSFKISNLYKQLL